MALGSNQPSENEYQEHLLGAKTAGAWGWRPHHLHVPNVMEIWEPKFPGTLWATPGLIWDSFTFTFTYYVYLYGIQWVTCLKMVYKWVKSFREAGCIMDKKKTCAYCINFRKQPFTYSTTQFVKADITLWIIFLVYLMTTRAPHSV